MTPRTKSRLADQHLLALREHRRQLDDLFSLRQTMNRQIKALDAVGDTESDRRRQLDASVAQINEQIRELEQAASDATRKLKVIGVDLIEEKPPIYA